MDQIKSLNLTKMPIIIGLLVLLLGVAGFTFYQYQQSQAELRKLKEDPQKLASEEAKKLQAQISKLIELPTNEEPTVATVTDPKKLTDQAFFAKAKSGDKVLIYTKARKAILYRPSINKIIEVAPINLGQTEAQPQKVTVALYNGTPTVGLTTTIENRLEGKFANIDVTVKENANKNDYEDTIVVDLSGSNSSLANQIADELGGSVGSLPAGETRPQADILVILSS